MLAAPAAGRRDGGEGGGGAGLPAPQDLALGPPPGFPSSGLTQSRKSQGGSGALTPPAPADLLALAGSLSAPATGLPLVLWPPRALPTSGPWPMLFPLPEKYFFPHLPLASLHSSSVSNRGGGPSQGASLSPVGL